MGSVKQDWLEKSSGNYYDNQRRRNGVWHFKRQVFDLHGVCHHATSKSRLTAVTNAVTCCVCLKLMKKGG